MKLTKNLLVAAVAAVTFSGSAFFVRAEDTAAKAAVAEPAKAKPIVQIAILLDTSGSMNGLIEQAKTQLWKIVTTFAKSSQDGVRPEIEVALYHYGSPSLGAESGYVKQLVPLSTDLDKISEELFKLKIDGGDEYCGKVIQTATNDLKWSTEKYAYKAIFIAGNEPFNQGGVNYVDACKAAIAKGIIVNTIYCGNLNEGVSGQWDKGAQIAEGTYSAIDQNKRFVQIEAPQDKKLAELSTKINSTYIAYGKGGAEGAARQSAQDVNAAAPSPGGAGGAGGAAERAAAKATGAYQNATWDLVDAAKNDGEALKKMKTEDLPEEMKKLDEKGRAEYVANKAKEREEIQKEIKQLSEERTKFIAEKQKEQSGEKSLDAAILDTVRSQAKRANLTFEEKP